MTVEKAVLFADRKGLELLPLTDRFPTCLLPIAGKTPLELWLEQLCDLGVKEVDIVINHFAGMIREAIPNGDHWGLKIRYHHSTGEESPSLFCQRVNLSMEGEYFFARADVLPIKDESGQLSNILTTSRESMDSLESLEWSSVASNSPHFSTLHSLDSYSYSYFAVVDGRLKGLTPRGLRADDDKWLATPSFTSDRSDRVDGPLYVGRDAMVDKQASINGCAIEAGSMVDKGAQVNHSIVFPGTYVGQYVTLTHSIASGSLLVDLKHNSVIQITDPALISPIIPGSTLIKTTTTERLVAAVLMLITAPIAIVITLLTRKSSEWLSKETQVSNKGSRRYPLTFIKLNFCSRVNWVNRWPELLAVIDGDIKLFGSAYEQEEIEPLFSDLPISQGLFTPNTVFKNHQLDQFEERLWGLELANEKLGAFRLFTKAISVGLKNIQIKKVASN